MTIDRSLDKIMLGCMSSYSEVGYFESADKIIALSLGCITALGQVMLPKASNLIQNGQAKESSRLLSKSLRFSTLFVSALLFGIIGVANNFVTIFFGKAFLPCTSVLMLLAPNLLVLAWTYTLKAQYLIPRGKDIPFIISTFAGLCVNGILCLLLIPILHAQGAAISTILAECFSAFIIIRYANNEINIKEELRVVAPYLSIGMIMMLIVFGVGNIVSAGALALVIQVIVGGISFVVLCFAWMIISKDKLLIEIYNLVIRFTHKFIWNKKSVEEA